MIHIQAQLWQGASQKNQIAVRCKCRVILFGHVSVHYGIVCHISSGHFIRNPILLVALILYWSCWKQSFEILAHVDMIAMIVVDLWAACSCWESVLPLQKNIPHNIKKPPPAWMVDKKANWIYKSVLLRETFHPTLSMLYQKPRFIKPGAFWDAFLPSMVVKSG